MFSRWSGLGYGSNGLGLGCGFGWKIRGGWVGLVDWCRVGLVNVGWG